MKIMAGHTNMTQAQLTALINERIVAALAAIQAGGQHAQSPVYTFKNLKDCQPSTFSGTEGVEGLLHWFERLETDFEVHDCPESRRVKFATGTLEGAALTWWEAQVQMLGLAAANATSWNEFKDLIKEEFCSREDIHKLEVEFLNLQMVGSEIEAYTKRSNELATFCPTMVYPPTKRIELYLKGLVPEIQSHVTAANLGTIQQVTRLAHRLTDQAEEQNKLPKRVKTDTACAPCDNKRKWDENLSKGLILVQPLTQQQEIDDYQSPRQQFSSSHGQKRYRGIHPWCNNCNRHHGGQCNKGRCQRCLKIGHEAKDCRNSRPVTQEQQRPPQSSQNQQQQQSFKGCFQCDAKDHYKRHCPHINQDQTQNHDHGNRDDNGDSFGGNNGNNDAEAACT
ncbi:putative transcription factor interactor and regulator CCHC(Zn) family [Helianthus annuus]|uniref:Transcription factor interactor and regulator CCHC(Zn) family n=1 Tax=Helianthus annuus TaxID=4232 RepID=A0A9K3NRI3_HELAN|nr:putative transcription factor interactor and regulator CCHC(Zn) family [Helianthus annuus]